jgi:hypothetical protein
MRPQNSTVYSFAQLAQILSISPSYFGAKEHNEAFFFWGNFKALFYALER